MNKFVPRTLKAAASERLGSLGGSHKKLVLCHTGVVILLTLLTSGLNLILQNFIGDTGGLSGLGTRSMLQTLQSLLQYAMILFTPFWTAGFVTIALRWADGQTAQPRDLLSGFSRMGAVLSQQLLLLLLYFGVGIFCGYLALTIFTMTPLSEPLMEILLPYMSSGELVDMNALPMDALMEAYVPLLVIYAAITLLMIFFLQYFFRLSSYFVMDECRMKGFASLSSSFRAMRGHKLSMLKLDLSFWWYYLLEALLAAVCYLDVILPALGIALPFNSNAAYFLFLILYGVLELALHLWKKPYVDTTYALAYRAIITPEPSPTDLQ